MTHVQANASRGNGNAAAGQQAPTPLNHHGRGNRKPHRKAQQMAHIDGSVSDSVALTSASPKSKKIKQRTQYVPLPNNAPHHNNKPNSNHKRLLSGEQAVPATPLKEHAYAGATFQASPAPSSLPVPKFFSKSVPNANSTPSVESRLAAERQLDHNGNTLQPEVTPPQLPARNTQQSPLDIFFQAQRAEQKEAGRATKVGLPNEQDGEQSDTSTPRLVLSRPQTSEDDQQAQTPQTGEIGTNKEHDELTKSLKELLFSNINSPPQNKASPQRGQRRLETPPHDYGVFGAPSPGEYPASSPSTPAAFAESEIQQDYYSFRYGNRNLSPLFKAAARNDSPNPPNHNHAKSTTYGPVRSEPTFGSRTGVATIDPNSFSRNFLEQQIRNPQLAKPGMPSYTSSSKGTTTAWKQQQPNFAVSGMAPTAMSHTEDKMKDVSSMEDDLRRMLNIKVFSN